MIDRSRRRLLSRLCAGAGAVILFNARGKASAPHLPKTHEDPPGDGKVASGGRTPQDLGLLDTVVVWPGETVRIARDFSQPFSRPQTYMLRCHNLKHEDQGMMVAFVVRDQASC